MAEFTPEDDLLYRTTERHEMLRWLEVCEAARDLDQQEGEPRFTSWEREFLASVRTRINERGEARHPLSGKQLSALRRMFEKV